MIEPLVERSMAPVRRAMAQAKLDPKQIDEVVLVGGSTRVPLVYQRVKEYFGKEPNKTVNPDEIVAIGAAIQGGVLAGEQKDVLLLDIIPISLGVETLGGVMTKMIERGTSIPTRRTETYTTAENNQTTVEIHVLQGEREMAAGNRSLGRFRLEGIPPAPRQVPQIEVTFDVDANGILNVTAKDKATGKEQKVTINGATGLSDDEIQKMIKDAEAHAEEDKRAKAAVDARNQLDSLVVQLEKTLDEQKDKLSADVLGKVTGAIDAAKQALAANDPEKIKAATQKLQELGPELAQAAAMGGAPGAAGGSAAGATAGADDVIDAEFSDKSSSKDVN
jgi:molecular chaperone DnaK